MNSLELIEVHCWGRLVGALVQDPVRKSYVFEYAPRWVSVGVELAPLMMPLSGKPPIYSFPELAEASYQCLPGMIADALPDKFGNALIQAAMAAKGLRPDAISALDKLAYMGRRGIGALEFRPARGSRTDSKTPLELKRLVEEARRALYGSMASAEAMAGSLADIIRVGTSAGGARAKAVIALNPLTNEVRSGQFEAPEGFEHWLLKFDGMGMDRDLGEGQEYGRVEYAYHLMASQGGVTMSASRLLEENGRAHFLTRRFDREGNAKHHVQSLCAMAHLDFNLIGTHAYEQYLQTIHALALSQTQLQQAFRRIVFNVLAKNCDDHTKNLGFLLKQGSTWELAPAYDITFAHNPESRWTRQHLMSVGGKFDGITYADLMTLAQRFRVGSPSLIFEEVRNAVSEWPAFASKAGVSPRRTAKIASFLTAQLKSMPRTK